MIPSWNMAGVLPPIRPGQPGHSPDRSPFCVSLGDVVDQFSTSSDRIKILDGLLNYRAELHKLGLVSGFQWLDGSFMEDVEAVELRAPKDVDVVTYFSLPNGETQSTLFSRAGRLFSNKHVKAAYLVDAYPHVLAGHVSARDVRQISYWYSMWSHRRDGMWKGFIQVDLDPKEDADARKILNVMQEGGVAS